MCFTTLIRQEKNVASPRAKTFTDGKQWSKVILTRICVFSSMVIRDLTLRSAASFGSFHLIRLLYDEYMFYLIEHKVAAATGKSPIAVMGEVSKHIRFNDR